MEQVTSPQIAVLSETLQKIQREKVQVHSEFQETERLITLPREDQNALAMFQRGETDALSPSELQLKLHGLERREKLLSDAEALARKELDYEVSVESLPICNKEKKGFFAEETRRILGALKAIDDANSRMNRRRDELQQSGVRTGSIPLTNFDMGGRWNDPYGGRVVDYRRDVAECYPDLKSETE